MIRKYSATIISIALTLGLCCVVGSVSCRNSRVAQAEDVVPAQPDYADSTQWYITQRDAPVDLFYITSTETGDYALSYYTDAVKNADFVLGMCTLQVKSFAETGIQDVGQGNAPSVKDGCFDLSGRRIEESKLTNRQLQPGLYIIGGRKVVVK